ncbi:MAG: VWA domain-containing protein [Spongiibacteraceae bacterium]
MTREHLRFKTKIARGSILHCFVVDCSGSMLSQQQLALAQGALLQLHQRAYQQRADIALISYAGKAAIVHIRPTAARPFNAGQLISTPPLINTLSTLRGGGGTPFARGIATANALLAENRRRKPEQQSWLWLLSDGRSNETPERPSAADVLIIIDCEQQRIALNRCRTLAEAWRADYQTLDDWLLP